MTAPTGAGMEAAARAAALALDAIERPYPYHLTHVVTDDRAVTPAALFPIFGGAFDWHSAVHGHWAVLTFAARHPTHPQAAIGRAAVLARLTPDRIAGERAYLLAHPTFERPYGLAWVLALDQIVRASPGGPDLTPLAELAIDRLLGWLAALTHPVRAGTHAQSAFAASLALDWARAVGHAEAATAITAAALRHHRADRGPMLHLEPSGEDFLSPALGAAALMARALPADALASWLDDALPDLDGLRWTPPVPTDRADGRLVHLDGLAASRAWMADELATALPPDDRRRAPLHALASSHRRAAIDAIVAPHYAGSHWLGTFVLRALAADPT